MPDAYLHRQHVEITDAICEACGIDDSTQAFLPIGVPVIAAEDSDDEDNTQAAGELDDATLADLLEITAAQAEKVG